MIKEFPEKKQWKNIYRVLGEYMTSNDDPSLRKIFSKNNLIIYPVIAGTVTEAEVSFDVTDFNNYSLSLSRLTWNGIQEVLKFFKIDKEFFNTNEKIRFWTLNGMIPRALYYSIETIKKSKPDNFSP
jgi:hypothetical protein